MSTNVKSGLENKGSEDEDVVAVVFADASMKKMDVYPGMTIAEAISVAGGNTKEKVRLNGRACLDMETELRGGDRILLGDHDVDGEVAQETKTISVVKTGHGLKRISLEEGMTVALAVQAAGYSADKCAVYVNGMSCTDLGRVLGSNAQIMLVAESENAAQGRAPADIGKRNSVTVVKVGHKPKVVEFEGSMTVAEAINVSGFGTGSASDVRINGNTCTGREKVKNGDYIAIVGNVAGA